MPPGVTVDLPWPFQLLRRFWGAQDTLAMILQEIKGKWNSSARPRPLPLQIQSCPRQCLKIVPVSLEGSGCAPAEGGQLPGLPTAPPWAGAVPVPAEVQRGGRAACRRGSGSSFCRRGQKAAEVVEHTKLLTLQCQCNPPAGYSLGIVQVLESKLCRHSAFGQTWVFACG